MVENIEFEIKGQNQSEIRLQHSTGEITTLLFNSIFPIQAQEYNKCVVETNARTLSQRRFV